MLTVYESKEILEIRKLSGDTPTEFAAKLGVSASAVCTWEKGTRQPKIDTMQKIAKIARRIGYRPHQNGRVPA